MKKTNGEKSARNELLSLLSILSIVAVFAAVCALCLFLMSRAGVLELPWFLARESAETTQTKAPDALENLFEEKNINENYTPIKADEETLEKIICSLPTFDSYFIRCSVIYISDDRQMTEMYNVWRNGDKYRIVISDEFYSEKETIFCDGEKITIKDADESERTIPVSGYTSFERFSPLPDFSLLKDESSGIIYTNDDETEYEVICDFPSVSAVSDIRISMVTGMILSVKTYCKNKPTVIFELISCEKNITDADFMN